MPDSLPTMLVGNVYSPADYSSGQSLIINAARIFEYFGYAEVNTTTGNVITLRNERDLPCTIPCPLDTIALSANDPAYLSHVSFYIPRIGEVQPFNSKPITSAVTSTSATDVLKLATAANIDLTIATTVGAASGPAVAGIFPSGITAGEAINLNAPLTPIVLTAATELKLYSATAASAAGVASGNIRVASGRVLIPCRMVYYRRLRSPAMSTFGISSAQRDIFDRLP
jgi:hypothetical protein